VAASPFASSRPPQAHAQAASAERERERGPAPIRSLGAWTIGFFVTVAEVLTWTYGALVVAPWLLRRTGLRVVLGTTVEQVRFTGAQALPLVALAALALGTLVFTQANAYVPVDYIPKVAATLMAREVVPLVVGIVIVGRSGTAIAVQLAAMRLEGEVKALVAMGMILEHVVVLPRLVGAAFSAALLGAWGLAVGLVVGYGVSDLVEPLPFRLALVLRAVAPGDVLLLLVKVVLFGAGAAVVAVREGLQVRTSSVELPRAATNSAVRGVGLCMVLNVVLSLLAA
jgi:phospholipid/cholesterol/gamma-HCH transport system permease protein